jgi:hypothetical protein
MKRFVCAALAIALIGSTAAIADPYDHGNRWAGYSHQDRGDYRQGDNGAGLAIGLGVGLFALAAVAASQHHDRYDNGDYGYGRGNYYGQGAYGSGYGGGYGSYGRGGYDNYRRGGYNNYSRGEYGSNGYGAYGGW